MGKVVAKQPLRIQKSHGKENNAELNTLHIVYTNILDSRMLNSIQRDLVIRK